MKITTGGTGIISSQSSMTASVLQQAIAGLNYEYTWAIDFSHPDVTTGIFYNMSFFDTFEKVSSGLRVALDYTGAGSGPGITFRESDLTSFSSTHSNGSSGNDIPNEAAPDTGSVNGINGNGVGHGGRYFSIVLTIDSFTINSYPPTGKSEINLIHNFDNGGANYFLPNAGGVFIPTGIKYVNGVAGTINTQAGYNAILGQVIVLTWDYASAYTVSNPDDDPDIINVFLTYSSQNNFDVTLHGMIFSDVPPEPITLPVEITNPTLGSGPA